MTIFLLVEIVLQSLSYCPVPRGGSREGAASNPAYFRSFGETLNVNNNPAPLNPSPRFSGRSIMAKPPDKAIAKARSWADCRPAFTEIAEGVECIAVRRQRQVKIKAEE